MSLRISRSLAALGFVLLSATGCWVFRAPLLAGAARWWIVEDAISKSDAVVVLGGGLPQRALEAARLYQAGLGGETTIYWPGFGLSLAVVAVMLALGVRYFRSTEKSFADVI